jgi:hypothetical protein
MHERPSNPTAMGYAIGIRKCPDFIKPLILPDTDASEKYNNLACDIVKQKMRSLHFNSEAVDVGRCAMSSRLFASAQGKPSLSVATDAFRRAQPRTNRPRNGR